jgi:hypothetical protein
MAAAARLSACVGPSITMAKEDGAYTFIGVAPGKYRFLAVDESDLGAIVQATNEDYGDVAESIEAAKHQTVNKDLKRTSN